ESVASASHCHGGDATAALNDGIEPKNSCDHDIPRFTWWDHRGTKEWAQYEFARPSMISAVSVYWFDDTGRGQCRVPATWRLLKREGAAWVPVYGTGEFGVSKDAWNTVRFPATEASALRIEVQLRDKYSGGILEWNVE
ncbi:MAG: transcriptional initiation protein Tat, partial [Verrucomicrobiae bacterium]|nr:transcriptional initiation protein Tat [Verrucomicrobiae bacterium]